MRPDIVSTLVLAVVALVLAVVASTKDPGLPLVRVVPSLAFPVLAGWLVKVFYQE
ncbi:MAG TPA: hypothetical protein VGM22_24800 [Methylomirabilota bacterium]|jgi:hypothetical protein